MGVRLKKMDNVDIKIDKQFLRDRVEYINKKIVFLMKERAVFAEKLSLMSSKSKTSKK